jgi:hypothetical protein
MFCVPGNWCRSIELTVRILEFMGLEELAAEVTLVATSISVAARTFAFYKAVC